MASEEEAIEWSLEATPTWAVATVCFILIFTSIFLEHLLHLLSKVRCELVGSKLFDLTGKKKTLFGRVRRHTDFFSAFQYLLRKRRQSLIQALDNIKSGDFGGSHPLFTISPYMDVSTYVWGLMLFLKFWSAELMLLGFISLLLTVLEKPIANICIPNSVGETFLPCSSLDSDDTEEETKCQNQVRFFVRTFSCTRACMPYNVMM